MGLRNNVLPVILIVRQAGTENFDSLKVQKNKL